MPKNYFYPANGRKLTYTDIINNYANEIDEGATYFSVSDASAKSFVTIADIDLNKTVSTLEKDINITRYINNKTNSIKRDTKKLHLSSLLTVDTTNLNDDKKVCLYDTITTYNISIPTYPTYYVPKIYEQQQYIYFAWNTTRNNLADIPDYSTFKKDTQLFKTYDGKYGSYVSKVYNVNVYICRASMANGRKIGHLQVHLDNIRYLGGMYNGKEVYNQSNVSLRVIEGKDEYDKFATFILAVPKYNNLSGHIYEYKISVYTLLSNHNNYINTFYMYQASQIFSFYFYLKLGEATVSFETWRSQQGFYWKRWSHSRLIGACWHEGWFNRYGQEVSWDDMYNAYCTSNEGKFTNSPYNYAFLPDACGLLTNVNGRYLYCTTSTYPNVATYNTNQSTYYYTYNSPATSTQWEWLGGSYNKSESVGGKWVYGSLWRSRINVLAMSDNTSDINLFISTVNYEFADDNWTSNCWVSVDIHHNYEFVKTIGINGSATMTQNNVYGASNDNRARHWGTNITGTSLKNSSSWGNGYGDSYVYDSGHPNKWINTNAGYIHPRNYTILLKQWYTQSKTSSAYIYLPGTENNFNFIYTWNNLKVSSSWMSNHANQIEPWR